MTDCDDDAAMAAAAPVGVGLVGAAITHPTPVLRWSADAPGGD